MSSVTILDFNGGLFRCPALINLTVCLFALFLSSLRIGNDRSWSRWGKAEHGPSNYLTDDASKGSLDSCMKAELDGNRLSLSAIIGRVLLLPLLVDSLRNDVTTQDKLAISVVVYSNQLGFELNVQS